MCYYRIQFQKRLASSLVGVSEIECVITGFSTNSASQAPMIQIGDSGGLETSGYSGEASNISSSTVTDSHNTGFLCSEESQISAAEVSYFTFTLRHMGSNVWAFSCVGSSTTGNTTMFIANGIKTLTGALDRLSITTSGGTATFDGGTAYVRSR